MRIYDIRYVQDGAVALHSFPAQDDKDFWTQLNDWEQQTGYKHFGEVWCLTGTSIFPIYEPREEPCLHKSA